MTAARRASIVSTVALAMLGLATPAAAELEFGPAAQEGFGVTAEGTATGSGNGDLADALELFRATEEGQRIEAALTDAGVVVEIEVLPADEVADGEAYGTSGIRGRDEDGNVTRIQIRIAGTEHLGSTQLATTIHHEMRHAEEQMDDNDRSVHRGIDADTDPLMVVFRGQSNKILAARAAAQPVEEDIGEGQIVFTGVSTLLDSLLTDPLTGDTYFSTPDAEGDVADCAGDGASGDVGADITGVVGSVDGDTSRVVVMLAQSPMVSMQQFSWAITLDMISANGAARTLIQETHDGVVSVGERDAQGVVDANGTEITLGDMSVEFGFWSDPNDPWAVITASGFSTVQPTGSVACDRVVAPALPFPMMGGESSGTCSPDGMTACLHGGRFSVELSGSQGPLSPVGSYGDGTVRFKSDDGAALVRVLNGCYLSNSWWVTGTFNFDDYEVSVTDTDSDESRVYSSSSGVSMPAFTDTSAFGNCPTPPAPDFQPSMLFEYGSLFNLSERAVYRSDDFTMVEAPVPSELDELRGGAVMIDGIPIAFWSGPAEFLDEITVELDRFSGAIQNPNGIDLVGAVADPLSYFEDPVTIAPVSDGETVILMPFAPAGPDDTDVGLYFATTMLGDLPPGTFAAIGGRLPINEIPLLGDIFRGQLGDALGRDGRTIPELLISVTPVIIEYDG